jgi:hypothetical protein
MAYTDDAADFDLDRFMQAMGFEPWRESEEFRWWRESDEFCRWPEEGKRQYLRREGDRLVIDAEVDTEQAIYELTMGLHEEVPEGPHGKRKLPMFRYRVPWPTSFNMAFMVFQFIGWFGHMPMYRQLRERYEALAAKR